MPKPKAPSLSIHLSPDRFENVVAEFPPALLFLKRDQPKKGDEDCMFGTMTICGRRFHVMALRVHEVPDPDALPENIHTMWEGTRDPHGRLDSIIELCGDMPTPYPLEGYEGLWVVWLEPHC